MRIQSPGDVYHFKLPDGAPVSVEDERMDLHAQSGHVLLLKLASEMPFDECGFAGTAITHQNQLECWHILSAGHVYNKAVLLLSLVEVNQAILLWSVRNYFVG